MKKNTHQKEFFYLHGYPTLKRLTCFLVICIDACTLHLFQSDPTPQFPFLRHSLLASLQGPSIFPVRNSQAPPPPRHSPGVWLAAARYTFQNTSGSHVLDACLQTLYRSRGTGHHLMRIAGHCRNVSWKRTKGPEPMFTWNHLLYRV